MMGDALMMRRLMRHRGGVSSRHRPCRHSGRTMLRFWIVRLSGQTLRQCNQENAEKARVQTVEFCQVAEKEKQNIQGENLGRIVVVVNNIVDGVGWIDGWNWNGMSGCLGVGRRDGRRKA